jgi:hypothetical protein
VARLRGGPPVDLLLTHQGPAAVQGGHGSPTLDTLLDPAVARFWFHGHSTPVLPPTPVGRTLVVPLGDVAFTRARDRPRPRPPRVVHADGGHTLHRDPPPFWRELRLRHWHTTPGGRLVHPELVRFV